MAKLFTCPICGGHLKINVDTGMAKCGSCGERTQADPAQLRQLREVCAAADRLTRQHTAAGCEEAIRLLQEISDVADVEERISACRAQTETVRRTRIRQTQTAQDDDKRDTATGILLIALIVLLCLAAVGGVIAGFVLWSRGRLSGTTVIVTACVIASLALLIVLAKK